MNSQRPFFLDFLFNYKAKIIKSFGVDMPYITM